METIDRHENWTVLEKVQRESQIANSCIRNIIKQHKTRNMTTERNAETYLHIERETERERERERIDPINSKKLSMYYL